MIRTACRFLLLVSLTLAGCAGASPGPDGDDGDDSSADDPNHTNDNPGDPPPDSGGADACDQAFACSDDCIQQMGCTQTDDACITGCDTQCGVEQACAGDPGGGDPGGGTGDPAACDQAWQCSDDCGQAMGCTDDACWAQCDGECGVEQACAGTDPGGGTGDPGGGGAPTCDEAWQCSDQCGAELSCGYDDDCWAYCDQQCGVDAACGSGG